MKVQVPTWLTPPQVTATAAAAPATMASSWYSTACTALAKCRQVPNVDASPRRRGPVRKPIRNAISCHAQASTPQVNDR